MEAMKYGKGKTNKGIKRVTEIIVADKLVNLYAFPIPSVSLAIAVREGGNLFWGRSCA